MKKSKLLLALLLCAVLAGCGKPASNPPAQDPSPSVSPSAEPSQPPESTPPPEEPEASPSQAGQQATLFIGTKAVGFTEYPMAYEGELTPDLLIEGIAELTGWNLTLVEPVVSGKDGMSVCLSSESALFTGPPDPQKDEFHMYSAEQLAETVLDSIQKTLQEGFTLEGGDPDAMDIWYYAQRELPLELPNLGLSRPMDQPYQWANAVRDGQ